MLELDPDPSKARYWHCLGWLAYRGENSSSPKECFLRALEIDGEDSVAWSNLGTVGGGRVNGKEYTAQQCRDMAAKFK